MQSEYFQNHKDIFKLNKLVSNDMFQIWRWRRQFLQGKANKHNQMIKSQLLCAWSYLSNFFFNLLYIKLFIFLWNIYLSNTYEIFIYQIKSIYLSNYVSIKLFILLVCTCHELGDTDSLINIIPTVCTLTNIVIMILK